MTMAALNASRLLAWLIVALLWTTVTARPLVRHIRSTHEFDRLLEKHSSETGLPVIVDFYSDGCGPCRMMAPIFKKMAKQVGQERAVFVKVDTTTMYELSSRYQIRSLPTFVFFLHGKKWNQFSGAGEQQLQQMTREVISQAETDNVVLEKEALVDYYKQVDASKSSQSIGSVYKKCAEMVKNKQKQCVGAPANQLARKLKKKYKSGPKLSKRFSEDDRKPSSQEKKQKQKEGPSKNNEPNLHLASKEDLQQELEKRLDEERDAQVEEEDDDDAEFEHSWTPSSFPEKVTIIGGGPAGISAAIYAARAGLEPVVVAPPMGGQLQGKGVDVENYPGLPSETGPGLIAAMRQQAADFGAVFEAELVTKIDATQGAPPFQVHTNSSTITTHSIIVATGAESKWLNVPGEWELRGGGVSSCATCDGAVFRGKDVVVVGGGDAAMEDALVLARTSKSVTVIHRRDTFRASKVLARRVMEHPHITIQWNSVVKEIVGETVKSDGGDKENVDLDEPVRKIVKSVVLENVESQEETRLACDAVFVAIGHVPSTSFLQDIVEFEENHPGYVKTFDYSTRTSVHGIFAAGDVADNIYRQAITSAGSGAAAALDAERWLSEEGLGNEAEELEAELMAEVMGNDGKLDISYNAYEDAGGRIEGMKESVGAEL